MGQILDPDSSLRLLEISDIRIAPFTTIHLQLFLQKSFHLLTSLEFIISHFSCKSRGGKTINHWSVHNQKNKGDAHFPWFPK
ncbi:hypothetical protein EYC80_002573 [Monilinia laxa]|uniref:Uncharacterized protein n=1 Tax=Monilinia laxa TaxID=61186 RepID=A0A5N6K4A7_MONLA|nr:hypothetical protein EYC80_002573 [Monilinia laxa]